MKGLMIGGTWDQGEVDVPEIPPAFLILETPPTPPMVYHCAGTKVEEGDRRVVIYEAAYQTADR